MFSNGGTEIYVVGNCKSPLKVHISSRFRSIYTEFIVKMS